MNELLKRKDVQKLFGVHTNTLTKWKQRGVLVPKTIGRLDYYKRSDIEELLNGDRDTLSTKAASSNTNIGRQI